MGRASKVAPAASSSLELPPRPGQRLPALLAVTLVSGLAALAYAWMGAREPRPPAVEVSAVEPSWVDGLVLVPVRIVAVVGVLAGRRRRR